jgi:acetylornithine deacetylase/succinyl-diaminopimelate desuccinylase-like protein
MEEIKAYIEEHGDRFLQELFGLIRIPSISSESEHREDMAKAAEYWKNRLKEAGADRAEVIPTPGNPVVFAEKILDPALPTILVYGHYDVMPVDPLDLWESRPSSRKSATGAYTPAGPTTTKASRSCTPRRSNSWSAPGTFPAT